MLDENLQFKLILPLFEEKIYPELALKNFVFNFSSLITFMKFFDPLKWDSKVSLLSFKLLVNELCPAK